MKVLMVQMNSTVGDFEGNVLKMKKVLRSASGVDLIVFPEAALCGYPQQDLLDYPSFAAQTEMKAFELVQAAQDRSFIFGSIKKNSGAGKPYRNIAIFADKGRVLATYSKRLLPTYDVFDEDRFFEAGREPCLVEFCGEKIGLTICEDIWSGLGGTSLQNRYSQNPLDDLKEASLFINISASPFEAAKVQTKQDMLGRISELYKTPLLYVNAVGANDAIIFDGRSYAWSKNSKLWAVGRAYVEEEILVDTSSIASLNSDPIDETRDIYDALVTGIKDYCSKQKFSSALLGLSGGIDSAVVACLAIDALGADNVTGVLLPSRFTSQASNSDALALAKSTQMPIHILSIEEVFSSSLRTLAKAFEGTEVGIAEENLQARIRGLLMMGLSNKFGGLLLSTGNKSELAVGYCTLYGDMAGSLSPLADVYKNQVYALGREANRRWPRIPELVFTKAPTAELRLNQTDQDTLPPYERLDAILKLFLEDFLSEIEIAAKGFNLDEVHKVKNWIGASEYKRSQMGLGLKVSAKAFGVGRRIPLVQRFL